MADAYGPPCSPGTRSPRSLASRRSSPPPLPRFFVRVCARAWTLLLGRGGRDYGLAFKAACCESETGQRDEWRATGKHRWRKKSREKKYPCGRNLSGRDIRKIRSCQSRFVGFVRVLLGRRGLSNFFEGGGLL